MNAQPYVNVVFLGLSAVAIVVLWGIRKKLPSENVRLAIAQQQFDGTRINGGDPKYAFAGNEAHVIRELKGDSNGESTNHLEQGIAQIVLKNDYQQSR